MKIPSPSVFGRRLFRMLVPGMIVISSAGVFAQTVATPSRSTLAEETIVLSPFTVSTDRDVGFVAASSLAGGRLATDLKDTPVAYSVLTREFIDALGIEDLNQAIEWTVGTHQNVDGGANAIFASNGSWSSRGVSGLSRQRNFFPYGIVFDSYNVDRFDFARGPNAVLFGAGGLGGAASIVTKQAVFGPPIRQVEARIGSWSNYRVTTDVGAAGKNFAVRANTLWGDAKSWRDDDYEKKKSAFLTTTYRFSPQTQIRLEGEYGDMEQRRAYTNINDRISAWDGTTTYATVPTVQLPGATRNTAGVSQYGTDVWIFSQAFGTSDIINFQNVPITVAGNAAGTFIGGQPIVGVAASAAGLPINYQKNLPATQFDRAIAGSSFRLPGREFTARFTNRPMLTQRYSAGTLTFNHQIGQSFFLEVAGDYNKERRFGDTTYNRAFSDVNIDINRTLPTGVTNPNYLKPYFEASQRYDNVRGTENLNGRFTAAYVQETKIGRFTFNLLGGVSQSEQTYDAWQLTLPFETDSRLWAGKHSIRFRQYWDQADRTLPEFPTAVRTVDPLTNTTVSLLPLMVRDTTRADSNARRTNKYTYGNAAIQANLFKNRLNLVAAYRRDQYANTAKQTRVAGDYDSGWNASNIQWKPAAPQDYYTLARVVARNASGNATGGTISNEARPRDSNGFRLAQYANDRFRDDYGPPDVDGAVGTYTVGGVYNLTRWLGLSANYAETFNPPGGNVGYDGALLAPSTSKGIDLGVRLNLLKGKLTASLNYFTSKQENAVTATPNGSQANFTTIFQANAIGDLSITGRNIRDFADLPLVLRDTIRSNTAGFEFEATANLTRQWRLLANFSTSEPLADKATPLSIAYWKEHEKDFRQILADTGVLIDPTTKVATADPSVPAELLSPDRNQAAAAWNGIQNSFLANIADRPRLISGSARITGNLFTDYTFSRGWLKGVRIGVGANFRSKAVIGFRGGDTIVSPTNPALAIDDPNVDAYTPVYNDSTLNGTATLAYTWKLKQGRRVSFNLRVSNLFNDDAVRYFQNGGSATGGTAQRPRNGDVSSPARVATATLFSFPTPINYSLSARLDF